MDQQRIKQILTEMENNGCIFTDRNQLFRKANLLVKKDDDLEFILKSILKDLGESTQEFLESKNEYGTNFITGISSCIYLPDYENKNEYKLTVLGGNRNRFNDKKVDQDTLFDIASITKLFTLVLLFKLEELGFIDLNSKISDVNSTYKYMEDFTFNDLIRLHGEINTNGRISDAKSEEKAWNMMHDAYLKSNSREENKYTDMGIIIMSDTVSKIISEKLGKEMSYDDIMNEFLFKEIGIEHSAYLPNTTNIAGNNHFDNKPHDPKARILGPAGHAGIFVNSDDLAKLAYAIMGNDFLNIEHKSKLGEITFPNSKSFNKGNLGVYVKTSDGLVSSYTPSEYSNGSFSHQGWTSPVATFDPNNLIHQSILTSAIYENEDKTKLKNDKPLGFATRFKEYQLEATQDAMLAKIVNEYYKRYCNIEKSITLTKSL